ncbi:cytochrome c oxidase assembly protein [Consotaella aegiceratis]|uniref:cytochrome c oxidase assembly protein n=1 Tax=Consotaella aegiceratis TaxID=3097961 RepID=UPI002F418429
MPVQTRGGASASPSTGTHRQRLVHTWPLWLGVITLFGLWLSPLVALSRSAFSAHMILHLGIVTVASPLIAIGLMRSRLDIGFLSPGLKSALAASAFDMFVVWAWHAPSLHEAAARHTPVFILQQASFLAAGLLVWTISFAGRSKANAALGAFAMLTTFMHMTMLGVLLSVAPDLIYAPDVCVGAFGFARLDDQRFGGVLMAVFGGLPYMIGGLALVARVLSEETAGERP